jgi:hypothetical protein
MPLQYVVDAERRLVRLSTTPPLTLHEVIAALARQITDGAWEYGLLVDGRRAVLSTRDAMTLADHMRALARTHGPHGPIAFVNRDDIAVAQRYAVRSHAAGLPFEVFWDVQDAFRWLTIDLQ